MLLLLTLALLTGNAQSQRLLQTTEKVFTYVGAGMCKPTGCVYEWDNCQVNGYYKVAEITENQCRNYCNENEHCIGFAHQDATTEKACWIFIDVYETPDSWTANPTMYRDIFTYDDQSYANTKCWMVGGVTRDSSGTLAFGQQNIVFPDSAFCGDQLPGDNHYGSCDNEGVKAKKLCQHVSGSNTGISGYSGNNCQASGVAISDGASVATMEEKTRQCAYHAAKDPDCAGNIYWVTGSGYGDTWKMRSCSCLVSGYTLDNVDLTSDSFGFIYAFDAALPMTDEEGEVKYKMIHELTMFYNLNRCGHTTPGNYALGECTNTDHIKYLCNGGMKCENAGFTNVDICAAAVINDPDCDVTFVASSDHRNTFDNCICTLKQTGPWTHVPEIRRTSSTSQDVYTIYPGTQWKTFSPTETPTHEPSVEPTVQPSDEPTQIPTVQPSHEPSVEPTFQPTFSPSMNPTDVPTTSVPTTAEPSMNPTSSPSQSPTDQPSNNPTLAPTRTLRFREVHFLNAFGDMVGDEENLNEFLTACTDSIRSQFPESTTLCVHAWTIAFDQMMVRIQDFCGTECDSLDNVDWNISKYGLNVAGFGQLYTEWTGTPIPTSAPSILTTPAPTAPCASQTVNVEIAVWMGGTVDWSITRESVTIVQEGDPEPPACHAQDTVTYLGPDDGEAPIPYEETCCLPGGQYILSCRGTFDWGDSSVSVNGQEYCRGLNGESQSYVIHLDGPAYNPGSTVIGVTDNNNINAVGDLITSASPSLVSVFSVIFVILALL